MKYFVTNVHGVDEQPLVGHCGLKVFKNISLFVWTILTEWPHVISDWTPRWSLDFPSHCFLFQMKI